MLGIGGSVNNLESECFHQIPPPQHVYEVLGRPPDTDEVLSNMKKMKCSSGGKDEVRMELIRNASAEVQTEVAKLVTSLWQTPAAEWEPACKTALVILLYKKKGKREDLNNWRGICLLSLVSRILARVVATRLRDWSEAHNGNVHEQYGFRPYRSTVDAIFTVRCLIENGRPHPQRHPRRACGSSAA